MQFLAHFLPSTSKKGKGRCYYQHPKSANTIYSGRSRDKERKREKNPKLFRQLGFFYSFPPPLSNHSALSPQTHVNALPRASNPAAEISQLQSQAPNKGFKMRAGHGTSPFNFPSTAQSTLTSSQGSLCPAGTGQGKNRCHGEFLLGDLRAPGAGMPSPPG